MSTAVVRSALCSLLTDQDVDCLESIGKYKEKREEVIKFVHAITKDETHLRGFDSFASKPMKALEYKLHICI